MKVFCLAFITCISLSACATEYDRRTDNYPDPAPVSIPTGHSTNF